MSFNFYIGASLWGFLSALLINWTTRQRKFIAADAAIGIITTASFALGVALISRYRTFTRSFDAALFGNILGVTDNDLYAIIGVTVADLRGRHVHVPAPALHDVRPRGRALLRREHSLGRHDLLADPRRRDRRLAAGARRDADRRDARHPADHRAAADGQLQRA